jgi:hypothetical protein
MVVQDAGRLCNRGLGAQLRSTGTGNYLDHSAHLTLHLDMRYRALAVELLGEPLASTHFTSLAYFPSCCASAWRTARGLDIWCGSNAWPRSGLFDDTQQLRRLCALNECAIRTHNCRVEGTASIASIALCFQL